MLVMTSCIQKIVTTNDLRVIRDSKLAIGLQSGLTKLTNPPFIVFTNMFDNITHTKLKEILLETKIIK